MDEQKKAPSDWYVLHTLTGQEMKVQKSIEARRRTEEMGDYIGVTCKYRNFIRNFQIFG